VGWANYKWAWSLRGVTTAEHLVCFRLADEANGSGYIEALKHDTLSRRLPTLGTRRVRQVLNSLLEKKLIKKKIHRFHQEKRSQVSNAYQLDLRRYHPPDPAGAEMWSKMLAAFKKAQRDWKEETVDVHAQGSSAFYDAPRRTLCIFLDSKKSREFFNVYRVQLIHHAKSFFADPPIQRLEFIVPGEFRD
jgi:hypothetical protein